MAPSRVASSVDAFASAPESPLNDRNLRRSGSQSTTSSAHQEAPGPCASSSSKTTATSPPTSATTSRSAATPSTSPPTASPACTWRWCNDFDAIVLDLNLPGMDGLEVCRKLRNEGAQADPGADADRARFAGQQAGRFRFRRRRLPGQAVRAAGSGSAPGRAGPSRQGRAAARAGSRPTSNTTSTRWKCAATASCCSSIRPR